MLAQMDAIRGTYAATPGLSPTRPIREQDMGQCRRLTRENYLGLARPCTPPGRAGSPSPVTLNGPVPFKYSCVRAYMSAKSECESNKPISHACGKLHLRVHLCEEKDPYTDLYARLSALGQGAGRSRCRRW